VPLHFDVRSGDVCELADIDLVSVNVSVGEVDAEDGELRVWSGGRLKLEGRMESGHFRFRAERGVAISLTVERASGRAQLRAEAVLERQENEVRLGE
jgi:hypothetical protein